MKIKIKNLSNITESDLVKFCVILLCIAGMMQSSILFQSFGILITVIKYSIVAVALMIFLMKIREKMNFGYLCSVIIISGVVLTTCLLTQDFSYLLVCIILILSRKLKIEEFIDISFKILVFFASIQILVWLINCVVNLGFPVYFNTSERRISFLFTHPNIAVLKLGWGIVMYTWKMWDKLNLKRIAMCYIATFVLFVTTKSDACMLILLYLILLSLRNVKLVKKVVVFISKYIFFVLGILNITLAQFYTSSGALGSLVRQLDTIFSRRIAMSYLAIQDNGYSIIGKIVEMSHDWDVTFNFGNYTIDSLYVYLFTCIGIVYYILISVGFYKLAKYKDYRAALVIVFFSLYALIEVHSLYLANSFALLLLKCVIFKEDKIT